ncbi:MAG: hypothetical protein V4857_02110 [Pseudomonadota bacterium]
MIVSKKFVLLGALIGALASTQTASAQTASAPTVRDATASGRIVMHNPPGFLVGPGAQLIPPDPYRIPSDPSAIPPDPYKCLQADALAKMTGQKSSCQ